MRCQFNISGRGACFLWFAEVKGFSTILRMAAQRGPWVTVRLALARFRTGRRKALEGGFLSLGQDRQISSGRPGCVAQDPSSVVINGDQWPQRIFCCKRAERMPGEHAVPHSAR